MNTLMENLHLTATLVALASMSACVDSSPTAPDEAFDPDGSPIASVDRFSDDAATNFRRSAQPDLPGPDEPIDFDASFVIDGFGPGGEAISYYSLDVQFGRVMPVHRIVDADGSPIAGQLPIVTALPGEDGYSDFWQFVDHEAPADYVANSIADAATLDSRAWPRTNNFMAFNRPLVPEGSTAERRVKNEDTSNTRAWIDEQVVSFLSFDEAPIPINGDFVPYALIFVCFDLPLTAEGMPQSGFCREADGRTHNVLESIPGDALYSPLWDVRVYDAAQFDAVNDLDSAASAPAVGDLAMVNCPIASAP